MKEFKALTESQLELLQTKVQQIQAVLKQAQVLQNQNAARVERMKAELAIPARKLKNGNLARTVKNLSEKRKSRRPR